MNISNNYMTSYKAAHRIIPAAVLESNVTSLDVGKELMPNDPNLNRWKYNTSTNINYGFKYDTKDVMEKTTKVNFDKMDYIMPQWEKYWSNPPTQINTLYTEYKDKYTQPNYMSNIDDISTPIACVHPKPIAHKEIIAAQSLKISDVGVVRKIDPYVSTQKLAYIEINPMIAKQINAKPRKFKEINPEYEAFYDEPIFKRQKTIRLLPKTIKHVPHNALKTEMSASYKTPINTLSKFDCTVETPISISRNPTLSQIFSVPGMYTTDYTKIGGNR